MAYFKKEGFEQEPTEKLLANYQNIIGLLGEDPNREGLQKNSGAYGQGHAIHDAGLSTKCG